MDIILEDRDEEKHRIRYTPLIRRSRVWQRDIPIYATSYDNERKKQARRRRFKFGNPRDQSKWVMDEHADIGDEDEDDETENWKTHWSTTFEAKMASIALILSTANLIRFPYSCYLHGGIVFFLAYSLVIVLLIQPLVFFELLIGQFSTDGIKGFSKLDKYAHGLPYALVFMSLVFSTYNNAVVGYTGIYAWSSIYTRQYVLDLDMEEHLNGIFSWKFLAGLVIALVLVALAIRRRLTSRISKILVRCSLIVPLLVLVLLTHQYSWQGASSGRRYFSTFRWQKMYNLDLWSEAIRMAFSTAGVGYGIYPQIASRHNFNFDQLHSTSWLVCGSLLAFSSVSTLVVFAELGIIGKIKTSAHYLDIFSERSGISFICLSGSLYKLHNSLASFIFFLSINIFGIWGQIVVTDMCTNRLAQFILKRYIPLKKSSRYVSLFVIIIIQLGFTSMFGTEAGHVMLDSGNLYGGAWAAVIILLVEMCTAFILYGYHVFIADIEIMMDYPLPALFQLQMKYYCGPALVVGIFDFVVTLILVTIHWFRNPASYHHQGKRTFWLSVLGIFLNFAPVIVMIIFALHTVRQTYKVGHLDDTVEEDLRSHLILHTTRNPVTTPKREREQIKSIFHRVDERRPFIAKEELEAHKWLRIHLNLKSQLIQLRKHVTAKYKWQKAGNVLMLAYFRKHSNVIKSVYQASSWFLREIHRELNFIEAEYLAKVVSRCSIENMIGHFEIIDEDNEERTLLNQLLRSVTLPKSKMEPLLPQHNEYGDIFYRLVGRLTPTREEQYENLIARVKMQLDMEDSAIIRAIRKRRYAAEQYIIISQEDAPLEFAIPLSVSISPNETVEQTLNIIIVKGTNHSLLRKLPIPRPLVLKIPYGELSDKSIPQVHQHITNLASSYMASKVLKETRPISPNPPLANNSHKLVYDFLNPRTTCVIVLEEKPFDWERRSGNWMLTRNNKYDGIKQAVLPNIEVTLAQLMWRNTVSTLLNSRKSIFGGSGNHGATIHPYTDRSSTSSSSSEGDLVESNSIMNFTERYPMTEHEELPRLIFWNDKVPPGDIEALREARKSYKDARKRAKYKSMYYEDEKVGNFDESFGEFETIANEDQTSQRPTLKSSKLFAVPKTPSLTSLAPSHSNESTFKFSQMTVRSPPTSLYSLKPVWSMLSVLKGDESTKDEFFDSEQQYKKTKLDRVTQIERRLNNTRTDYAYYTVGKCLIVQLIDDNVFVFAKSDDSIASLHDKNEEKYVTKRSRKMVSKIRN